jgi:hypothetical protein
MLVHILTFGKRMPSQESALVAFYEAISKGDLEQLRDVYDRARASGVVTSLDLLLAKDEGFSRLHPFHVALASGLIHVARELRGMYLSEGLALRPLMEDTDNDPEVTALMAACLSEDAQTVEFVLSTCAPEVNAPQPGSGRTALHIAARQGLVGVVQALLAVGAADRTARDAEGRLPVDDVCAEVEERDIWEEREPVLRHLLEVRDRNPSMACRVQSITSISPVSRLLTQA